MNETSANTQSPSGSPIRVERLAFRYVPDRNVLSQITISFAAGRVTAILGPNGAGKSTLLRLLVGALKPTSGRVLLDERSLGSHNATKRAARIAYVAQSPRIASAFTVEQVVRLGRFATPAGAGPVQHAMEQMQILQYRDDPYHALSAGQQQRVAIARALAQLDGPKPPHPKILIADEPVAAMDPIHTLDTLDLLRRRARDGDLVILSLHDLSMAARFADDAILLSARGGIAAHGPAPKVLQPEPLRHVFGARFRRVQDSEGAAAFLPHRDSPDTIEQCQASASSSTC